MRFPALAPTPLRLPLACDPLMVAANSKEALDRYRKTGDATGLVVPEGVTHIVVRPLTPLRRTEAERVAGQRPQLGAALATMLDDPDEAVQARARAEVEKPGGAEALAAYHAWSSRLTIAAIDVCVTVEGAPDGMTASEALGSIHGESDKETWQLRARAETEAGDRVWSASLLGSLPKAP